MCCNALFRFLRFDGQYSNGALRHHDERPSVQNSRSDGTSQAGCFDLADAGRYGLCYGWGRLTKGMMGVQYAALAALVVAEAIIFVPLLFIAQMYGPGVIQSAALVTLIGFAGLTAVVFVTRKDFSFLRSALMFLGVVALVLIAAGVIFGFELGTYFSVGMVAFAGAAILYDTSNILHHYPEDRYVGAALELFASVALMFWYVLRLFMSRR